MAELWYFVTSFDKLPMELLTIQLRYPLQTSGWFRLELMMSQAFYTLHSLPHYVLLHQKNSSLLWLMLSMSAFNTCVVQDLLLGLFLSLYGTLLLD